MQFLTQTYENNIWKYYAFEFFRQFFFIGGVLIIFFTDWGGISQTQIQILQSWYMLALFILEVPTGIVADCWGRKQSLVLAGLTVFFAVIVYGIYPNIYLFFLGELFFALSGALRSGANEALIYDSLKELKREKEAKTIIARGEVARKIAIGTSAIIGGYIAKYYGLQYTMLFSLIPMVLHTLVALTFKEPLIKEKKESRRYMEIFKTGIKNITHNKTLKILAIDTALLSSLAYFVIWLYQRKLATLNIDLAYFGYFSFLLVSSQIVILLFPQKLEKLLGSKKNLLALGAWTTAITFILIGFTDNITVVMLFLVFAGGLGLTRKTIMAAYMNKYIPSPERATTISAITMMAQLLLVFLNPLVGYLVDWNLNGTFIILGSAGILIALFSQIEEGMLLE